MVIHQGFRAALLALMAAAVACGGTGGGAGDVLPWERDYQVALSRAGDEGKPIMVEFYTDWCGWCKRLERDTFSDAKVQQALESFIPVKLNAEREGRELATRLGVRAYPTVVFFDSRGQELGRIPGYMSAEPFLEELGDVRSRQRSS